MTRATCSSVMNYNRAPPNYDGDTGVPTSFIITKQVLLHLYSPTLANIPEFYTLFSETSKPPSEGNRPDSLVEFLLDTPRPSTEPIALSLFEKSGEEVEKALLELSSSPLTDPVARVDLF